jgi:hypothetical protein
MYTINIIPPSIFSKNSFTFLLFKHFVCSGADTWLDKNLYLTKPILGKTILGKFIHIYINIYNYPILTIYWLSRGNNQLIWAFGDAQGNLGRGGLDVGCLNLKALGGTRVWSWGFGWVYGSFEPRCMQLGRFLRFNYSNKQLNLKNPLTACY